MHSKTNHSWKLYLQQQNNRLEIIILSVGTIGVMYLIKAFLSWNEKRPGLVLNDVLLGVLPSIDFSILTGILTNGLIFSGLVILAQKPDTFRITLLSAILISLLRMLCMYFVPLDPPHGIIPLRDLLLENTFYCNQVMVLDCFFQDTQPIYF